MQCLRIPVSHHASLLQMERVPWQKHQVFIQMRDKDHAQVMLAAKPLDQQPQDPAVVFIQRSGGFVQKQHVGLHGEGAGDRQSLRFAPGELCRRLFRVQVEPHVVQQRVDVRLVVVQPCAPAKIVCDAAGEQP